MNPLHLIPPDVIDVTIKLLVAMFLGIVIGTERILAHKTAGMRTYALVAVGAALFVIVSVQIGSLYSSANGFSPSLMASAIITGVGFLGTGVIFKDHSNLIGLTSATGIWVSAGIGMAAGYGLFSLAIITTLIVLFVFSTLWLIEERIKKIEKKKRTVIGKKDIHESTL